MEVACNWTCSRCLQQNGHSKGGLSLKISEGSYRVQARKVGFATQKTEINLKKSDVRVRTLEPFTALKGSESAESTSTPNPFGSLVVYSYPEQCMITLVFSRVNALRCRPGIRYRRRALRVRGPLPESR
jgi:hypothetical protein